MALGKLGARGGFGSGGALGRVGVISPILIANRSGPPGLTVANTGTTGGGTATDFQEWQSVILTEDISAIQLVFGNFTSNGSVPSQVDVGPADLTLRVGVKPSSGGAGTALNWLDNGSRDITLTPGQVARTVLTPFSRTKGTRIYIGIRGIFASAVTWPAHYMIMSNGSEFNEFGSGLTDRTTAASWAGGTRTTNFSLCTHLAVLGTSAVRTSKRIILLGDSIMSGHSNDSTFGDYGGFGERALAANYAWSNVGASGGNLTNLASQTAPNLAAKARKYAAFQYAGYTHALCNLITNEFASGQTDAQAYVMLQTIATELMTTYGIKLIPCTAPPRTNAANNAKFGTDSANVWTYIQNYNATLASNNGVGYGYFDVSASWRDGGSPNLWRTDLGAPTSDGIHPNTVLHTQAATDLAAAAATLFV